MSGQILDFRSAADAVRTETAKAALLGVGGAVIVATRVLRALGYTPAKIEELVTETARANVDRAYELDAEASPSVGAAVDGPVEEN